MSDPQPQKPPGPRSKLGAPEPSSIPEPSRAPIALVRDGSIVFGSWEGFPGITDLINARKPYHYLIPRFLKRLRLKEWQAIEAGNEDWFLLAVLYDAKFLTMASIDLWNRKEKKKYGFRHIFPGSRFSFPHKFEFTESHATAGGDYLSIRLDPEMNFCGLRASSHSPASRFKKSPAVNRKTLKESFDIDLSFDLTKGNCAPYFVCLPLGVGRAMYSAKILMPCSGAIKVAGREYPFDPWQASGILDDHKGYYPYRLHYDWITGFGMDESGRRIGFNLTDNQVKDQVRYNENRLWIDGAIYPLPPVKITRPYGRESPWNIQDTEGLVDLIFHPEVSHDIQVKLGIAEIDYAGPFGRFEGRLLPPQGESIDVSRLYGMGEDKNVRL